MRFCGLGLWETQNIMFELFLGVFLAWLNDSTTFWADSCKIEGDQGDFPSPK